MRIYGCTLQDNKYRQTTYTKGKNTKGICNLEYGKAIAFANTQLDKPWVFDNGYQCEYHELDEAEKELFNDEGIAIFEPELIRG